MSLDNVVAFYLKNDLKTHHVTHINATNNRHDALLPSQKRDITLIDAMFSYTAGLTSRSNDFYYRTFSPYYDQRMSKLDVSFLMQPPLVAYKRNVSWSVPQMTRLLSSLVSALVSVLDATPAITSVLTVADTRH